MNKQEHNKTLETKLRKLNYKPMETDLFINHQRLFNNFITKQDYLTVEDKVLIKKYYTLKISSKNIMAYYQHPIQRFAQHLINGTLKQLEGETSYLNRKSILTIAAENAVKEQTNIDNIKL